MPFAFSLSTIVIATLAAINQRSRELLRRSARARAGSARAVCGRSPQSLYDLDIATMEKAAHETCNQDDATGFIRLNALRLKNQARRNQS